MQKKGISLIVLVITIIVMIILAAAIIISINNANVMEKANEAVSKSDFATIKNAASLEYANIILDKNTGDKWQGEYVKDKLIEQGILTEDSAKQYRFYNNGEVVKLLTEQEYNEKYKEELAALDTSYYSWNKTTGEFSLTQAGKNNLTTLVIPYGVTKVGNCDSNKLTKVVMPDTVTTVNDNAFTNSRNLENITFSNNLQSISKYALRYTSWKTLNKNAQGLLIVNGILIESDNISGKLEIPDSVEIIAEEAFYLSYGESGITPSIGLTSVVIPSSVEKIEYGAFFISFELTEVQFRGKIPYIGDMAFGGSNITDESVREKILEANPYAFDMFG